MSKVIVKKKPEAKPVKPVGKGGEDRETYSSQQDTVVDSLISGVKKWKKKKKKKKKGYQQNPEPKYANIKYMHGPTLIEPPKTKRGIVVHSDKSFKEAFAHARKTVGDDGVFHWRGKEYTTKLKSKG